MQTSTTTDKIKPDWAGDDMLSRVVNAAIGNSVLYEGLMKPMARRTLINTAEKNGVAWRDTAEELEKTQAVYSQFDQLEDASVEYPEYYLKPFHAYSEGNLCWQAAFEAEPATLAMALRVWPQEGLTWDAAQARLRASFLDCISQHISEHQLTPPQSIVDVGCSVGLSTRAIHDRFEAADIVGLDLSPYMLAVAAVRDEQQGVRETGARRYVHGAGEATGMADASVQLVTLSFLIHELPQAATVAVLKEAARILAPGGILALTDNNPQSAVIQKLPPALFTLMKSTEPHSDEYYTLDVEHTLRDAGFTHVHTESSDPRHRTVLGTRS